MNRYVFFVLLTIGIGVRVFLLRHYAWVNGGDVDVYLADEGIVGLMAKHILEGRELPVFFYGQSYLGALEAYCAAAVFSVFGVSFTSLRLVPFLFSLAILALVYRLAYLVYSVQAARWATALLAVAPLYFLQWNLKARGGFVEHIALLLLTLVLFWRFFFLHDRRPRVAASLGFIAGVALWTNQLAGAYVAPLCALVAMSADRRGIAVAGIALVLGASLLIGYNVMHPLATFRTLARKAVVMNRVPVEERDARWVWRGLEKRVQAVADGADKLGLVFGVPAGEETDRLGLSEDVRRGGPITRIRRVAWWIPCFAFGWGVVAAFPRRGPGGWDPFGMTHLLALALLVTVIVGYVSPRYMLPAYPLAAVLLGAFGARSKGVRRRFVALATTAVVLFNVASWLDPHAVVASEHESASSELLHFLEERGLTRCYSAGPLYHLVFRSNENVILAPLQKDRYPRYAKEVERAPAICYVFRQDQAEKKQHRALVTYLSRGRVSYRSERIGPYEIFWEFSLREALDAKAIAAIRRGDVPDRVNLEGEDAAGQPWT